MSLNMPNNSYDEILYFSDDKNGKEEIVVGNVVSYKDNVFYISNDNRELITIKAFHVITKPYFKK